MISSFYLLLPSLSSEPASQSVLFTPDIGVFVLTVSALLFFLELNRPGLVLPGAIGLLGVLLAINSWRAWHLSMPALLLLLAGAALPVWQLRHAARAGWPLLSALAMALGFAGLVTGPAPAHVHWPVAFACGIVLGAGASLLARIAHRARQNKGLN